MTRLQKLWHALSIVLFFPLLHFASALLMSYHNRKTLFNGVVRFFTETMVFALSPFAAIKGRYPTSLEIRAASQWQIAIVILFIIAIWLYFSLFMVGMWAIFRPTIDRYLRRRHKFSIVVALVSAVIMWTLLPRLPSPNADDIHINLSETLGDMPPLHRGFSQGGEIQMRDAGYFETAMEQLALLKPAVVRIDHLYDYYGVYALGDDGQPIYDWTELDRVVNAIIESGAEPFMSVSYTPPALSNGSMTDPPSDSDAWQELVYQTVYHFNIERSLNIRYWEVWNEPNLPAFWGGTPEAMFELYWVTVRSILRADPTVFVGGLGTVSHEQYGAGMLILNERDWVTGLVDYVQTHGLRLDFLSWHLYDTNPDNYRRSIDRHQAWVSELDPPPQLILSEWNWEGGTAPEYDNGETAAYMAAVLDVLLDTPLDMALFFEPIDGTLTPQGYWGLMYRDGTPKPAFFAFQLLSQLSGEILLVDSTHPDAGAIATRNGDDVTIVVWNDNSGHDPLPISLHFSGLPNTHAINLGVTDSKMESNVIEIEIDEDAEGELVVEIPENGLMLLSLDLSEP